MINKFEFAQSFSNEYLHLIILPTEKCNFRCTYCYEDFKIGIMKEDTIIGVENLIENRISSLKKLNINWFGGEPLLANNVIKRINSFVIQSDKFKNNELEFNSEITTNGYYLDLATFEELVKLKITQYQISIDGSEEFHNTTRILANGKGTYQRIWENLKQIKKSKLKFIILIRLHITELNYCSSFQFIKQIEDTFLDDERFILKVKAIGKYGGSNDHLINPISEEQEIILQNSIKKYQELELTRDNYICYASKPNSFVIRADGKIGKCTVALNESVNNVGTIDKFGKLEIDTLKMEKWAKGFYNNDFEYLSCPMSKINTEQEITATNSTYPKGGF